MNIRHFKHICKKDTSIYASIFHHFLSYSLILLDGENQKFICHHKHEEGVRELEGVLFLNGLHSITGQTTANSLIHILWLFTVCSQLAHKISVEKDKPLFFSLYFFSTLVPGWWPGLNSGVHWLAVPLSVF